MQKTLLALVLVFIGCQSKVSDEKKVEESPPLSDPIPNDLPEPISTLDSTVLWGQGLPEQEPAYLLGPYDEQKDISKVRPDVLEERAESIAGGYRIAGNIDVGRDLEGRRNQTKKLRLGERSDYLDFWLTASHSTNYPGNAGIQTLSELHQFAEKARSEAIETIPILLEQFENGEILNPKRDIDSMCRYLHLTEKELGLRKEEILERIARTEKAEKEK